MLAPIDILFIHFKKYMLSNFFALDTLLGKY